MSEPTTAGHQRLGIHITAGQYSTLRRTAFELDVKHAEVVRALLGYLDDNETTMRPEIERRTADGALRLHHKASA